MRPQYETDSDLRAERETMNLFLKHGPVHRYSLAAKLPDRYKVDYGLLTRNRDITGYAEVKVRDCSSRDFADFFISLDKIMALVEFQKFGESYLIVRWEDCAGWLRSEQLSRYRYIDIGGRYDRGDAEDIEPMVYYPTRDFHIFWEKD